MKTLKLGLISVACLTLPSCAGVVTAWKGDPFQAHDIPGPSIYSMTGDRRTAVFNRQVEGGPLRYCAESMPDGIAAMAASSNAKVAASGLKGGAGVEAGFADTTSISLLQTFQRTENAELLRQLGWNLCLAWTQGAIKDDEYRDMLKQITTGTVDVMKAHATAAPAPATPTPTPPAAPLKVKSETQTETRTTTKSEPVS